MQCRLSEQLLKVAIHTVGTFRSNRGEPQVVREAGTKMRKGEIVARDNGKVMNNSLTECVFCIVCYVCSAPTMVCFC